MRKAVVLAAILLTACGSEAPIKPAASGLVLQPLGAPEFQQYHIELGGCAFVPEGGALGALLITDREQAYLKANDMVATLATTEASAKMSAGAWDAYAGGGYAVSFTVSAEGEQKGSTLDYRSHLTVRDAVGATLYDAEGMARCGA